MDHLAATPRMLIVFSHLLLCVFALNRVLGTDLRLLTSRISAPELQRAHVQTLSALIGLWATGLLLAGIDLNWNFALLSERPKLMAKLICVVMLSANGVLLRLWCFPRLVGNMALSRPEALALMVCGAISTTSWLMAAFFGIARPMQSWPLSWCLGVYWLALAVAVPVALLLEGRLRRGREARAASLLQPGADDAALEGASPAA